MKADVPQTPQFGGRQGLFKVSDKRCAVIHSLCYNVFVVEQKYLDYITWSL